MSTVKTLKWVADAASYRHLRWSLCGALLLIAGGGLLLLGAPPATAPAAQQ